MTAKTLLRLRRRLKLSQAGFARLLATTPNTVARLERGEKTIRPPMARLALLVAHLAEIGDDYAEQLASGRKPKVFRSSARDKFTQPGDGVVIVSSGEADDEEKRPGRARRAR